jgi:hypothetical protein
MSRSFWSAIELQSRLEPKCRKSDIAALVLCLGKSTPCGFPDRDLALGIKQVFEFLTCADAH